MLTPGSTRVPDGPTNEAVSQGIGGIWTAVPDIKIEIVDVYTCGSSKTCVANIKVIVDASTTLKVCDVIEYDDAGLVVTLNAYKAEPAGGQLWFAASVGNTDAMTRLLAQGVPPDEYRDEHKRTALNIAAYNGKIDAVKILVEAGADVNAIQNGGHTVLQCAVEPEQGGPEQALKDSRSLDVVNVLIAAGADPSIVDWNGSTALIEARDSASSGPQRAAIVAALEKAVSDLASDATA